MLCCRFLKCVQLNFVSNLARRGAGSGTRMQVFKRIRFIAKRWPQAFLDSRDLGNRFGFAGVYTRQNYINLEVHLNYKLTSKRVTKAEQALANRFHHTIKLTSEKDDKELLNWLREAYELKK
jgi:Domain of unknown function (DUF5655)